MSVRQAVYTSGRDHLFTSERDRIHVQRRGGTTVAARPKHYGLLKENK